MENILVTVENANFHIHGMNSILKGEKLAPDILHMHFYPEFHYVYEGTEYIKTKEETFAIKAGELCVIPSRVLHNPQSDSVTRVCFNVLLNKYESDALFEHDYYDEINNFLNSIDGVLVFKDTVVCNLMQTYHELLSAGSNEELNECQRGLLLVNILMKIVGIYKSKKGAQKKRKSHPDTFSERKWIIEEYISNNYNRKNCLSELAKELHIGERRTRDLVKIIMGVDFKNLIVKQRMEMAKILLSDGSFSKDQVARLVGYNSYSGFYISYKNFLKQESNSQREKK